MENQNKTKYRLKEKYNNIPLEFGSNIFVNNLNLTDEYAKKLLEIHKAQDIFEKFPKEKTVNATETSKNPTNTKK